MCCYKPFGCHHRTQRSLRALSLVSTSNRKYVNSYLLYQPHQLQCSKNPSVRLHDHFFISTHHHLTIYQGKLMPPVPHPQIHLFSLQNMSLNRAFFLSLFVLSTSRANIYFRSRASRAGSDAFRPVVKGYSFFLPVFCTLLCAHW